MEEPSFSRIHFIMKESDRKVTLFFLVLLVSFSLLKIVKFLLFYKKLNTKVFNVVILLASIKYCMFLIILKVNKWRL